MFYDTNSKDVFCYACNDNFTNIMNRETNMRTRNEMTVFKSKVENAFDDMIDDKFRNLTVIPEFSFLIELRDKLQNEKRKNGDNS